MKTFRVFDLLVLLVLISVLLWSAFLFWGAYSQHRISILLNEKVLCEIKTNICKQMQEMKAVPDTLTLNPKLNYEIEQLRSAQKDLFDANTISFIFQFITLFLVTVGVAILAYMQHTFREAQEKDEKLQEKYRSIHADMASFIKGRNTTVLLAVKYSWLHTLCQIFVITQGRQRDALRTMMIDYQTDIQRQLEDAKQKDEGFEEELFTGIILDAALNTNNDLKIIKDSIKGFELDAIKELLTSNTQSLKILQKNGVEFTERYKNQSQKIFNVKEV